MWMLGMEPGSPERAIIALSPEAISLQQHPISSEEIHPQMKHHLPKVLLAIIIYLSATDTHVD